MSAPTAQEERLHVAMDRLINVDDGWHELLHDPFKAPELKVGLPSDVTAAA